MKPFLQLNLNSETDKVEAPNFSKQEREEQKDPLPPSKRFNKFVKSTAHKAASHSGRSGSGMFTK